MRVCISRNWTVFLSHSLVIGPNRKASLREAEAGGSINVWGSWGDRQRARSGEELTSLRCPWDVLMWEWKLGMCIHPFKASPGKGPIKSPGSAAREGPVIVQLTKEGLNLYSWRSANATLSPPGQSLRPGLNARTWMHTSHMLRADTDLRRCHAQGEMRSAWPRSILMLLLWLGECVKKNDWRQGRSLHVYCDDMHLQKWKFMNHMFAAMMIQNNWLKTDNI